MPDLATDGSVTNSSDSPPFTFVVSVRPQNPALEKSRKVVRVSSESPWDELGPAMNAELGPQFVGSLVEIKGVSPTGDPERVDPCIFTGMQFRILPTAGLGRLEA